MQKLLKVPIPNPIDEANTQHPTPPPKVAKNPRHRLHQIPDLKEQTHPPPITTRQSIPFPSIKHMQIIMHKHQEHPCIRDRSPLCRSCKIPARGTHVAHQRKGVGTVKQNLRLERRVFYGCLTRGVCSMSPLQLLVRFCICFA